MELQPKHTILLVDDDEDDCLLVKNAFDKCGFTGVMVFLKDGEELIRYLNREGEFLAGESPYPDLILLDLNMPRMDGRQALQTIKADPKFRAIPIIIFTTSNEPADIQFCYDHGASSFMTKPNNYKKLIGAVETFCSYWFNWMRLPRMRDKT